MKERHREKKNNKHDYQICCNSYSSPYVFIYYCFYSYLLFYYRSFLHAHTFPCVHKAWIAHVHPHYFSISFYYYILSFF